MQIYLPIAELSVNIFVILGMGGAVGFLSGMFGVGGGFLMTPLLIFYGIPPAVAVATQSNQITASSVSGVLVHWRRRSVDVKLGMLLTLGGVIGSIFGVWIFAELQKLGQVDLIIALSYVVFLGVVGGLMLVESVRALLRARKGQPVAIRRPGHHTWVHGLPLKTRFKRSKLYVSMIPILVIGAGVGILTAIMGVGGGFIMIPAMIYILRVPTNVVIGTSLLQILIVTAVVTVLHATTSQTVDAVLALLLMTGGVIGAQFGAQAGQKLRGDQLRALLALLVLAVCLRVLFDLVLTPDDVYSITMGRL